MSQVITEDLKITPVGAPFPGHEFGMSCDIQNGVIIVGAPRWSGPGGAAFLHDSATGNLIAELVNPNGAFQDRFGESVAIDAGVAAVGSPLQDLAFLFDVATQAHLATLIPLDGFSNMGNSIAIAGGIVAVGAQNDDDNGSASGSVYLFDITTGAQLAKLLPNDGAELDQFGHSVAIENGIVAVGAWGDSDNGPQSGSVYLFDAATGMQTAKIYPSDASQSARFGQSLAMDNGIIAVGAHSHFVSGLEHGAVYLFDASTGVQSAKLTNGLASQLGWSVDIDSGIVAVGATGASLIGTAYLFDAATGTEIAELNSSDGANGDSFGQSIGISGGDVVVGATKGSAPGFLYKYSVPQTECLADTNHDGAVSPADFTAWIAAFNAMAPECDQNGDGSCTPADFTAWIANFNAGC